MRSIPAGISAIVTLPAPKGPADELIYRMDWTAFLTPLGDTILASDWDAGGLTASSPTVEAGNLATGVRLAGGSAGTVYTVSNMVTTAGGRTVKRSFKVKVEER